MICVGRKIVTTRKSHTCFGCGREFSAGTRMEKSCTVEDGSAWSCYLCPTCVDICDSLQFNDSFGFGDLREEALEREVLTT